MLGHSIEDDLGGVVAGDGRFVLVRHASQLPDAGGSPALHTLYIRARGA